jgi:hypothetical protein
MALKGTLKDFSLADILQLIGIQRKTGVLNLHGPEDLVSISFVQGSIVSAESATRRLEDRVAETLLKQGCFTEEELERARATQQQTLDRLWLLLRHQQSVTSDEIRRALHLQVERIIYPVFRWTDGEYSFIQEAEIDYDREHLAPIHSETVLMEGVRMVDEWPLLERRIRSDDQVFSRAPVQERIVVEGDAADASGGSEQITMSEEEYRIYDLVDGRRTVGEIKELSPTHDFNTVNMLASLLGLGLITSTGDARGNSIRNDKTARGGQRSLPRLLLAALPLLVAVAVLTGTVPRLTGNPVNVFLRQLTDDGRTARLSLMRDTTRMHQLERTLESYRLEFGDYPGDLEELSDRGFAEPGELLDSQGRLFSYRCAGGMFTLTVHSGRAGPATEPPVDDGPAAEDAP